VAELRDSSQTIGEIAVADLTEMESVRTGEVTKKFRRLVEVGPMFLVKLLDGVCPSVKKIGIQLFAALFSAIGQGQQIVHGARK
jgi:hypothetical protein